MPGSEYDVAFDAEGAPVLAGEDAPRYLDRLAVDDPRVLEWTAEQRLAELAAEQEARARRDADGDAIGAACRPLRVLYPQARRARQRTALLAVFSGLAVADFFQNDWIRLLRANGSRSKT